LALYCYCITDDYWRPEVRENSTLCLVGTVLLSLIIKKIYLYGGYGNQVFNITSELNLANWRWRKLTDLNLNVHEGRFGHTANK